MLSIEVLHKTVLNFITESASENEQKFKNIVLQLKGRKRLRKLNRTFCFGAGRLPFP